MISCSVREKSLQQQYVEQYIKHIKLVLRDLENS